ncbi:MAG: hypothetical protein U0992_03570 [Planctomycetaceae bacterium]
MRSFGQGIKHLVLAVIWLAALICISEVALRTQRWHTAAFPTPDGEHRAAADVVPSTATYQQLRPMVGSLRNFERGGLRTNSFGLRGPEVQIPKPAGTFRVVCLGDDTTLAVHLAEIDTYCERLRNYLQERTQLHVEVVNAGLPGGCPLTGLLLMRQRLLGLQPDLVLQHVDPTDVSDDRLVRPFTFMDEQGTPLAAIHPSCRNAAAPTLLSLSNEFLLAGWVREQLVEKWRASTADNRMPHDGVEWEMAAEQSLGPLALLRTLVSGAYCEVIVTAADEPLQPSTGAVADRDDRVRPASGEYESPAPLSLAVFAREQNLRYLDASAELRNRAPGEPPLIVETAEEHDLYAALQAEFIIANVPGVWSTPTTGGPGPAPTTGAAPVNGAPPASVTPGALPATGAVQPLSDASLRGSRH